MPERCKQFLFVATVGTALIIAVLSSTGRSSGQAMPILLQITSPADGTIVHPGQTVTVVVTPNSGASFTHVYVEGHVPIGASPAVDAPPYQLSLPIPQKIPAGSYPITAFGVRPSQNAGRSPSIKLDVEPSLPVTVIRLDSKAITFKHAGDKIPVSVWGTFSDGSTMNITQSSGITYTTGDSTIATVDKRGVVTAVGHGSMSATPMVATYGDQTASLQVSTTYLPPDTTP
jgi:hypothetical protein